jgi:hypothetical protein
MCAQGVNWNTAQPYTTTARNNSETFVFGAQNDTTVGEKTEIVIGGWGDGVVGPKVDVIAGAQLGMILGVKGEYTFGVKYDRVPYGEFHVVGDFSGAHASHSMTVGTSFFVNAGVYAQILAPTLILTASAVASEAQPEVKQQNFQPPYWGLSGWVDAVPYVAAQAAVPAVYNTTTLSLLQTQALLTAGGNSTANPHPANLALTQAGATLTGITPENLVSILAAALLINHATSASLGISNGNSITANAAGVTIIGNPAVTVTGAKFVVAAPQTYIGQPAVTVATYAALLKAAEAAAEAAATAAAAAATKAVNAGAMPAPGAGTGH